MSIYNIIPIKVFICASEPVQSLESLRCHGVEDPVQVTVDSGVNSWNSLSSTEPRTEADDSYQVPPVPPGLEVRDTSHQTTPTVSHTRVLQILENFTNTEIQIDFQQRRALTD